MKFLPFPPHVTRGLEYVLFSDMKGKTEYVRCIVVLLTHSSRMSTMSEWVSYTSRRVMMLGCWSCCRISTSLSISSLLTPRLLARLWRFLIHLAANSRPVLFSLTCLTMANCPLWTQDKQKMVMSELISAVRMGGQSWAWRYHIITKEAKLRGKFMTIAKAKCNCLIPSHFPIFCNKVTGSFMCTI